MRRAASADRRSPLGEVQPHPVRQVGNRRVDRPASHGAYWKANCRQPAVFVHHVRPCSVRRGFKIIQREADRHSKPVSQSRAYKVLIALPADPFDNQTSDVVAEVVVLPGRGYRGSIQDRA
jgi:hypothetical protein